MTLNSGMIARSNDVIIGLIPPQITSMHIDEPSHTPNLISCKIPVIQCILLVMQRHAIISFTSANSNMETDGIIGEMIVISAG